MAETQNKSEQVTPERAREIVAKTAVKTTGMTDYLFQSIKKGRNFHQFNGKRYDVDTFYGVCETESLSHLSNGTELYWEQILKVQGKPRYRVWRYGKDYGVCPTCEKTTDVQFIIEKMGVYLKCQWCKVTTSAPPFEIEDLGAEPTETKAEKMIDEDVDMDFADEVCKRTGQPSPFPEIRGATRRKELKKLKDYKQ